NACACAKCNAKWRRWSMKSKSRSKVRAARPARTGWAVSPKRSAHISRPFVSATFAMTVDGKITTRDFAPVDFTSPEDKRHLFRQRALADKAILHLSDQRDIDLVEILRTLRRDYKVRRVACEGGPILFRSLLELGLVDELNLTIAPYLFGGVDAPTLTGLSKEFLPASVHCVMKNMRVVGNECFLTYRIRSRR